MKNDILYYYNINVDKLHNKDDYYYFYYDKELYELVIYNRDFKEDNAIYKLNRDMINNNIIVHEIILNKDNKVITIINNIPYTLYKVYINKNKKNDLNEIEYLSNLKINYDKILMRSNWDQLWADKIDYFEYQIRENGKKYPIIVDSFSYFVGLAENAISYAKNTIIEEVMQPNDIGVIAHRKIRIEDTVYNLYNPLNIIIDHKSRDLGEYIKNSFFTNNKNVFNELDLYFSKNYFSEYGIRLLFARILYPTFYFDLYEDIILNKKGEEDILNITTKVNDYEKYLYNIYLYLRKFYPIPEVEWLKKNKD